MNANPYAIVEKAIVDAIKLDRLGGKSVRWWPTPKDQIPIDREPTSRQVPAVRVEVGAAGPSRRLTNEGGPILRPMLATVSTWTEGPGNDNALYLWAVIEAIFDPTDPEKLDAIDAYLESRGIWSLKIQRAAIPTPEAAAAKVVVAVGVIEISYWDEIA